jgi:hypothetical protein
VIWFGSIGGFVAVAVAVAYLTATRYSILPKRSGLPCYQAVPPCPPLPASIQYVEPNWGNGIGVAVLVAIALIATVALLRRRWPQGSSVL